jgi:hypothetical protein
MKIIELIIKNFKNLVVGALLLLVAGLGYQYYAESVELKESKRLHQELIGEHQEFVQLALTNIAQLGTSYVEQEKLRKIAEKKWSELFNENKKLKGQIAALASATFTVENFPHEQDKPDIINDLFLKQEVQYKKPDGELGPPIGYVQIFNENGKTVSGVYKHDITVDAIVTEDPKTGRYRVLTKGNYILRDDSTIAAEFGTKPNWKDVPYPLTITGGEFWIDPRKDPIIVSPAKFRWAPHLNVGGFAGVSGLGFEAGASGGVSLWGYGRTTNDLDYKLGQIGINGSRNYIDVNLTPISWRVGNVIPLVEDLYVGPGVGFGNHGVTYFLGLHTTL